MDDPKKKLNWMLHYAGPKVQSIYYTLPEKTNEEKKIRRDPLATGYVKIQIDEYDDAVEKLFSFFEPKQNTSYERHIFRQLHQKKDERIDMFLIRLREQADRCDFGDQLNDNIRDQITSGCSSDTLRRKILERGDENLESIVKVARIIEAVAKQQQSFGKGYSHDVASESGNTKKDEADVCKIEAKNRSESRQNTSVGNFTGICGRCGLKGHKSADGNCPAKGKTCNRCGRKDHFARKCFLRDGRNNATKRRASETRNYSQRNDDEPDTKVKREAIQLVQANVDHKQMAEESDYEDVFCIDSVGTSNKIWCTIGGVDVEMIVDSGSRYNIIDRSSWIELKKKDVQTIHKQREVDINFQSYGGHQLKFLGMFRAVVKTPLNEMEADFYVANEFGKMLLGFETATVLKVLKIGYDCEQENTNDVNTVDTSKHFGKIKGVVVEIPIKHDAKGVIQPYRRVPAPLEKIVDNKIDEMLQQGIIEKVDGVSKWVSQMVIAPKADNDVRICVDMRRANLAVERENHPLPTIDDFLPQLGEAKVFSKLDVKQAFHQVKPH